MNNIEFEIKHNCPECGNNFVIIETECGVDEYAKHGDKGYCTECGLMGYISWESGWINFIFDK